MRVITITLFMLVLLSGCASGDVPQGGIGPPYDVPAESEGTTQKGYIRVNW